MTAEAQVAVDIAERLLTITLDRPARMNAFTPQMLREMLAAFDRADADDAIRAVIVTGRGERAFCAGADLADGPAAFDYTVAPIWSDAGSPVRPDGSSDWNHEGVRDGGGLLSLRIFRSRKPVIGAINGAAVGIGATMTLPMDFLIASEGARFGFVFARRGIVPEAASSWFLPRRVGISTALDWSYSGRMVGAAEARAAGLVRLVVSAGGLIDAARSLARDLTDGSAPVSVALTRAMMWRMLGAADPMAAHRIDSRLMWERGASADAAEGVGAFLEKRRPHFNDSVDAAMADLPAAIADLRW
jgi:enoyl-CoA hydratase/carnithine racemase